MCYCAREAMTVRCPRLEKYIVHALRLLSLAIAGTLTLGCAASAGPQDISRAQGSSPRRGSDQTVESRPATAASQPETPADGADTQSKSSNDGVRPAPDSVTQHSIKIGDRTIEYTATAGTVLLAEENGKERAHVFYIAYTLDGVSDTSTRPITFCFNGGPGSSSVWLHLGAFGPRRVEMGDAGSLLPPPWKLVDNEQTLLDITDLVFIDPVTTGYSRAVPPENDDQFHGVQEDIESVGDFIRIYTTRAMRWNSPKFIAGESYGTARAAGLSGHLLSRHGMYLNGVILVSAILNFQTTDFGRGNDLPFALYLPSYTATAWYHKQLEPALQADLERTLDEVEAFASTEYLLALQKGDAISADERAAIVQRLSRYTGLPAQFIDEANLRISLGRFNKELLRDQRRTVGRLDSRFLGIDYDAAGDSTEFDPSYAAIQGPYTAAFYDYVRRDLNWPSDLTYEILTGRVRPWSFREQATNRYLNVAETLRSAMSQNQAMRVFLASGYYDFATPYFAAEYTMDHLMLDPSLRDHIMRKHYQAGHMMYVHPPSLEQLRKDLGEFYDAATRR
jgi:carboxypeptidase C (cathepsin A)